MTNLERKVVNELLAKVESVSDKIEKYWNPLPGDYTGNVNDDLRKVEELLGELLNGEYSKGG